MSEEWWWDGLGHVVRLLLLLRSFDYLCGQALRMRFISFIW